MTSTAQAQAAMIASPIARSSSISASLQIRSASSSSISGSGLLRKRPHSVTHLFFKSPQPSSLAPKSSFSYKPLNLVMQWQDCKVKMEIDVPTSVAYECYSDREAMPQWLPFVSSVKVLEDQQDLSQMSLKYSVFGQQLEYSLLARNLQPIPNQKIHWRSLQGLPNRGAVRFYPKGSSSCIVELTVSYEVPQILAPVASALVPFTEGMLLNGLKRFSRFAKQYQSGSSPSSPN